MSSTYSPGPVVIPAEGPPFALSRLAFARQADSGTFDECWLQEQLYSHPKLLPIEDIDSAFTDCIPVCRELMTQAGPLDVLYVTPEGRLVIVETKLWRNPSARREVVTQILDYAKELATWTYEDLSREVAKVRKTPGVTLFDIASQWKQGIDSARFIDSVSRTLRTGRFLLLIVGDGIREGVHALTAFLDRYGSLEFTFGLLEVGVYEHPRIGRLLQTQVLAKTMIINRSVISLAEGLVLTESGGEQEQIEATMSDWPARSAFYLDFWTDFLKEFKLDDATQPLAKPTKTENIYFPQPPSASQAWISAYFAQSKSRVGVYLRLADSEVGKSIFEALLIERDDINVALGGSPIWAEKKDGKLGISVFMAYSDLSNAATLALISQFFASTLNKFVNEFRPRLRDLSEELNLES